MADLRIVDAPVLLQESITDDVKMPTGGLGNYAIRLGDLVWYVVQKEQLTNKSYVDALSNSVQDNLDNHVLDKNNPHQVTKQQVGLGNVDNVADIDKPVSNATKSAIITATTDMATKAYVNQQDGLKADKAMTLGGYGITDAYTKDETYSKIDIDNTLVLKADVAYVDGKDGDLTTLTTNDKTNLVKAINEVYKRYEGVGDLYEKNVEAGAGANGWTALLVQDASGKTQQQINDAQKELNGEYVEKWAESLNLPLGDNTFRQVTDLYTLGSANKKFNSRTELETWLGFGLSTMTDASTNTTIDAVIIQKAINELSAAYQADGVPRTLVLKDGAVYYVLGLQLRPGVNIVSNGLATLKKRPAGSVTDEAVLKWWRIAVTNDFNTAEKVAHRCEIRNIVFDGNYNNMNWSRGYTQEQGASLVVQANGTTEIDIRAKYKLSNVHFKDSVGDGLLINANSDVLVDNMTATNCFRGGLVLTQGNSILVANNLVFENARLDIEVDWYGFNQIWTVKVAITNYYQDKSLKPTEFVGGCDLGGRANSEFYFDNFNCYTQPTNIITAGGSGNLAKSFEMRNSTLTLAEGGGGANRIINPANMLFDNVKFRLLDNGFLSILTNFNGYTLNDDYIFRNCSAEQIGATLASQVFKIESQVTEHNGKMILDGGDYSKAPLDYIVTQTLGGKTVFDNVKHAAKQAIAYRRVVGGYGSHVEFKRINDSSSKVAFYKAESSIADTTQHKTVFDNSTMQSDFNILDTSSLGLVQNSRVIYGDTPPTSSVKTIVGDTYRLNVPTNGKPYEWVATTSNIQGSSNFVATKWLTGSFATANLPVLTAFDIGTRNFDTTTNTFKTWNGTAWI